MGVLADVVRHPLGLGVMRPESPGALHDACRQAARDERDRLGSPISDYVCGRICEAVLAVVEHRPLDPPVDPIDCDSEELR